eukprot:scaffold17707_cov212-Amphora_coffeaeformis.AAC.8
MMMSIYTVYEAIQTFPQGTNPVKKALVAVIGSEAVVYMEEIEEIDMNLEPPVPAAVVTPTAMHTATPTGTLV